MTDLRTYMSSDYFADDHILRELDASLMEISDTFCRTYDEKKKSWPYELRTGTTIDDGAKSQSTDAMILCAALAMLDRWPLIRGVRASSGMSYWPDFKSPTGLCAALSKTQTGRSKNSISKATERLFSVWTKNARKQVVTCSRTFGEDDPMLLGWVIDLLQYTSRNKPLNTKQSRLLRQVLDRCLLRARELGQVRQTTDGGAFDNRALCRALMTPVSDREVGDSSYILLRFAIVIRSLRVSSRSVFFERAQDVLFERFESRLHEQLSFAEIVDSRFDPTEIIFCLEGMLLTTKDAVSKALFDRVMSVLRDVQGSDGYWRSETPIVYNKKGEVLFTVSVESANSILASFALYDERWSVHESIASEHIDLIRRYWKWLKARKSFVRISGHELKGWHSEHVNDPDLIHLWETSQVAEFLVNFRDQLQRHIARRSLSLSRCSYKRPQRPGPINISSDKLSTTQEKWDAATKQFEPVTCLGKKFRIYERLGESFVNPRVNSEDKLKYSALLFGPPGTGKTSVAATLSWALDYPLIIVTVSDFLADGHAAIEARAKDLFYMLRAQPRSIVLFDEIDQFMLDRDSQYFKDQDTVFQFLTPGMLTKLNDLRSSESVIFIMATNYAERIDAAIKRQGRIDEHCLLLPPDTRRRMTFIKELWPNGTIAVKAAAQQSVFLGYGDMNSVRKMLSGPAAIDELRDMPRPAQPVMYASRFRDKSGHPLNDLARAPHEEFFCMVLLEADSQGLKIGSRKWKKYIWGRCQAIFDTTDFSRVGEALTRFLSTITP